MVNLRYFISMLSSKIEEGTSNIIDACLFLTTADINFFRTNNCLISIKCTSVPKKYDVELDREQLLALRN